MISYNDMIIDGMTNFDGVDALILTPSPYDFDYALRVVIPDRGDGVGVGRSFDWTPSRSAYDRACNWLERRGFRF